MIQWVNLQFYFKEPDRDLTAAAFPSFLHQKSMSVAALNPYISPDSPKPNNTLSIYFGRHIPEAPKVKESIMLLMQEITRLIPASTIAGEATDTNHNYRERETSVNFPHTEPACDWFSTQISKRVLLSYL